jgi:hypothetical protein
MLFFLKRFLAARIFLFLALFALMSIPEALAQQNERAQDPGQEASLSQTQATMASLFGRGATMPVAPRVDGIIALPSPDNSGTQTDENGIGETGD